MYKLLITPIADQVATIVMTGSSSSVCEALVLAYPCSIDSGPNAEIFVDNMTARKMLPQLHTYLGIQGGPGMFCGMVSGNIYALVCLCAARYTIVCVCACV